MSHGRADRGGCHGRGAAPCCGDAVLWVPECGGDDVGDGGHGRTRPGQTLLQEYALRFWKGPGESDRAIMREIGGFASGRGTGASEEKWSDFGTLGEFCSLWGVTWNYWWVATR